MPSCPPPRPPARHRLAEVTAAVEGAHHAAGDVGPSLVRVRGLDEPEVELALAPVPSGDVLDCLLGTLAPLEWDAVGVVVDGTARRLDPVPGGPIASEQLSRGTALGSVRVAVLVARDGSTASVLRGEGDEPLHSSSAPGESGPHGRVADALRRTLGLSTSPPTTPVAVAVAHVWLHRVLTFALRGDAIDLALVESLRPPAPAHWSSLREQCAAGGWAELDCSSELAAWMDDGMFARWCEANFAEPLDVLVELSELVEPVVAEHLARALAAVVGPGRAGPAAGSVPP